MFWDTRNENYLSLAQTDRGVDYTVFAPDLTLIDGGVWEMDSAVDLKFVAVQLQDVSEYDLAELSDYDQFTELVLEEYSFEVVQELNELKAEALANMESPVPLKRTEDVPEKSEKAVTNSDEPKSEQKAEVTKSGKSFPISEGVTPRG